MKALQITEEKVKQAAIENPKAAATLRSLFPEVFEDDRVFCNIGCVFIRPKYNNLYSVFKENGFIKVLNITHSIFWKNNRILKIDDLKDPNKKTLTYSEFIHLTGEDDLSKIGILPNDIANVKFNYK